MLYNVILTGKVEVSYSIEVDADDETDAKQAAVERAPVYKPSMWVVRTTGMVTNVDADWCEASEEE